MIGVRNRKGARRDPKDNPPKNRPEPNAPVLITGATKSGNVLTLVFDQQVNLEGTPGITTDLAGVTPVSAVKTNPTTVEITYSGAITTATELNIPYMDRAIRNLGGGYVYSPTFQLAA
jgi:hypothetical protein